MSTSLSQRSINSLKVRSGRSRATWAARLWLPLLVFTLPVAAQAQFTYTANNGTITITGYICSAGAAIIPDTIDGLPVTTIGGGAFQDCTGLTSVSLPNSVTTIGNWAFLRCTGLTSVTVPNSVATIGDGAFSGCTALMGIEVEALNPAYSSLDGVLFTKHRTTLLEYPGGKAGIYTLPNSVINIGEAAFYDCTGLTSVTLPTSVTTIGSVAFHRCTGLTSVTLPNSLTTIEVYAFTGCTGLTNVTIPDSVTTIGDGAFAACTGLTSVSIPDGVTTIGNGPFAACTGLKRIEVAALNPAYSSLEGVLFAKNRTTLLQCPGGKTGSYTVPDHVTTIGGSAFSGCTGLTSITIPHGVTTIGNRAFAYCTVLKGIEVAALNSSYRSMDGLLFAKDGTTLLQCPGGKAGNYTLPDRVTMIGGSAFSGCTGLTSVTLPNSVIKIEVYAFSNCTGLTSVYCLGKAPAAGDDVFDETNGVTVYYLPGATGWGATYEGRPTALWSLPYPVIFSSDPGFGFLISWATNAAVVVEASPDLVAPDWTRISTNTLTAGSAQFTDPQWTDHPTRFYRVRTP